jgi:transposase-like protein
LKPFEEKEDMWLCGVGYRFNPTIIYCRKTKLAALIFIINETMIQIGDNEAWLWIAIEPVHSTILGVFLSRHRNMLVVESFLKSLMKTYGKHSVYSDGGGTWYPASMCFSWSSP